MKFSFQVPTYQVEVVDEKSGESMWPFLQFDAKGNLKDAFCSCESEKEELPPFFEQLPPFFEQLQILHFLH